MFILRIYEQLHFVGPSFIVPVVFSILRITDWVDEGICQILFRVLLRGEFLANFFGWFQYLTYYEMGSMDLYLFMDLNCLVTNALDRKNKLFHVKLT